MPKVKIPRKSTFIDMTPMVDMAFLLVTFFMLTTQFKPDEPVKVSQPSSISTFKVRDKEIKIKTHYESLSHTMVPKISSPKYKGWGDILKWVLSENYPGEFPYAAGIYPFKREGEDPTRMFAGEGGPERTNKRFHYVSLGMPAKRLSTAFDSVTLYGQDPTTVRIFMARLATRV